MARRKDRSPSWDREEDAARAILAFVRQPKYRALTQRELLHHLQVSPADRGRARASLDRLVETGRLTLSAGGKVGVGRSHQDGARGATIDAFAGSPREIWGLFRAAEPGGVIEPMGSGSVGPALHVPGAFRHGALEGQIVRASVMPALRGTDVPTAKVLETLGAFDAPGVDLRVITGRYGYSAAYPEPALAEADEVARLADSAAHGKRESFDDPPPVTIDGAHAKDFDDAIAVSELSDGGFRLWVHVADVSHFVREGSPIDAEARRRGTSVYLPELVIPMLPELLSNDLCSLRPGEDRLVQTVIIDYRPSGDVRRVRFADGLIRSAARLTYGQAAALMGNATVKGVGPQIGTMLRAAGRLAEMLAARRQQRGSIDFDLPEPELLLDVQGAMTGIVFEPRTAAHRLIEAFMIEANEAVAARLVKAERRALFRSHEPPDPTKVEVLSDFLASFGVELGDLDLEENPEALSRALASATALDAYPIIAQATLRTMKQARYSSQNEGHFGLASWAYCHFTSPIRRYPDLVVHRVMRDLRRRKPSRVEATGEDLDALALECSELERRAEAAEREILAWKKVAFIARQLGTVHAGLITAVVRFGLFVQLRETGVEGLVRIEVLGDEWFEYDERCQKLTGSRSGRSFRVGDPIDVRVVRVDRAKLRVDLELAERPASGLRDDRRPRPSRSRDRASGGRRSTLTRN